MYIDIFILGLLLACIVGLCVALLFLVRFYSNLIGKIQETEKEKVLLHSNITQKAQDILSQAHKQNEEIIVRANEQAGQILSDASKTKMSSDDLLKHKLSEMAALQEETLKKLSAEYLASHEKALSSMQSQDLVEVKKISEQFENKLEEQLTEFSTELKKETLEAESQMGSRIEQEYAKNHQEIEQYKQKEIAKIQESLPGILERLSVAILGKSFSTADHEQLIQQALEEAKKEIQHSASNYKNIDQITTTSQPK